jgi:hypothetical protein
MEFGCVVVFVGSLQAATTSKYNSFTDFTLTIHYTATYIQSSMSSLAVCLTTFTNNAGSLDVLTPLLFIDCLSSTHGHNYWPLTPSLFWPPLATTRCNRLALN